MKILVANKINLKNGRAAYQLKDWEVVRSNSGSASATSGSAGNTSALMSPMRKAKIGSDDSSGGSITKLSNLNPYSSVWEIEVTVLKIDPIREFKNGTGKLQNLTVCDDSGTILWVGLFLV